MNNTGSKKKFGVAGKTATVVMSVVLVVALIVTIASGLIPGTVLRAEAQSAAVIESEYGENYIPSTYTAVNVPAGTLTMTADQYSSNAFNSNSAAQTTPSDGLAVFDFHIFAENFASGIHTCGNIAVENLGVSIGSTSGAPEFGSRADHDTLTSKLSYVGTPYAWQSAANADAFVFGSGNTLENRNNQIFLSNENGEWMMGNGTKLLEKCYIEKENTKFIDVEGELSEAEDYQRYLVWLMNDIKTRCANYYVPGWGYATTTGTGESVRVLTYADVCGFFGTSIDFSKFTESTIIIDLPTYENIMWGINYGLTSYATTLISGSVKLSGTEGKRIIFNVDTNGLPNDSISFYDTTMTLDGHGNQEASVNYDSNILWNFYNSQGDKDSRGNTVPGSSTGTVRVGGTWMGTILAPDGTVSCNAGLNGSIIAKNVTTYCETHKSDYTGEKISITNPTSLTVTKIWQDDPDSRPDFITVKLLQNGTAIKTAQVTGLTTVNEWTYTFTDLPVYDDAGNTYRYSIEEIVPAGYTCDKVNNTLINTSDGEVESEPVVGSITIYKKNSSNGNLPGARMKMTVNNGQSLAGATPTSGVENFKATDSSVTWTTTNQAAVIGNLPYGTYTITEESAPAGYKLAGSVYVNLSGDSANATVTDDSLSASFEKQSQPYGDILPGATLVLTSDTHENLFGVTVTGAAGTPAVTADSITWKSSSAKTVFTNIPAGTYTITETSAPVGYDIAAPVTFRLDANGNTYVNNSWVSKVVMTDALTPEEEPELEKYNITISKVSGSNASVMVSGATLRLTRVDGKDISDVEVTGAANVTRSGDSVTFVTENTAVSINGLLEGSYVLTEVTAPAGYAKAAQISFNVTKNDGFVMKDDVITATVSKRDATSGEEISGAVITITGTDANGSALNLSGVTANVDITHPDANTIRWISGGKDCVLSKLPAGVYTMTELTAPAGYQQAESVTFTIDEFGKVTGTTTMYDQPNVIEIEKYYYNKNNTGTLNGAALRLTANVDLSNVTGSIPVTHENDNTVSWTSGTAANSLRGVPDGTYTLHEVEAPEGFDKAEDIHFTVSGGKITSPYTVDDNSQNVAYGDTITIGTANITVRTDKKLTMVDKKTSFWSFDLSKVDGDLEEGDAGYYVAGAKLAVFDAGAKSYTPDEAIVVMTTGTSQTRMMLADGDYVLVELEAPDGFDKTDEKVYFTVENGELTVTKLDASELAVASYGDPSAEGLSLKGDCFYTLEATEIFKQYGEFPESVSFDLPAGYKCAAFALYEDDGDEASAIVNTTAEPQTHWSYKVSSAASRSYDPKNIYYAVINIVDESGNPADPAVIGDIDLKFSYPKITVDDSGNVTPESDSVSFAAAADTLATGSLLLSNGNAADVCPSYLTIKPDAAATLKEFEVKIVSGDTVYCSWGPLYPNMTLEADQEFKLLPIEGFMDGYDGGGFIKKHPFDSSKDYTIEYKVKFNTAVNCTVSAVYDGTELISEKYEGSDNGTFLIPTYNGTDLTCKFIDITDFCAANGALPDKIYVVFNYSLVTSVTADLVTGTSDYQTYGSYSAEVDFYGMLDNYTAGSCTYTAGAPVFIRVHQVQNQTSGAYTVEYFSYGITKNVTSAGGGASGTAGGNAGGSGSQPVEIGDIEAGSFVDSNGGKTAYIKLPNYKTPEDLSHRCSVVLTKADKDATSKKLPGAKFLLYDGDGKLVEKLVYVSDGVYKYDAAAADDTVNCKTTETVTVDGKDVQQTVYKALVTGANGTITVNGLDEGSYYFKEIEAPANYEIVDERTDFVLNLSHLENSPKTVAAYNKKLTGEITLIKTDDAGMLRPGATFELYKVDPNNADDTNLDGELYGTFTTGNDGKYTVSAISTTLRKLQLLPDASTPTAESSSRRPTPQAAMTAPPQML